jgi:O-methyltransferase
MGVAVSFGALTSNGSRAVKRALNRRRLDVVRHFPNEHDPAFPADMEPDVVQLLAKAAPFTMTTKARPYALHQAVAYVTANAVPGAMVECGVWRGGSMLLVADTLVSMGVTDRELYLFDTYTGMPAPGDEDIAVSGESGDAWIERGDGEEGRVQRCEAGLDEVRATMAASSYPARCVHLVAGMVEDTIPQSAPREIALLRLDTDWYASTKHELEHLFDRLVPGGVLIVDDYGWWKGSRQAVDEFFAQRGMRPLLQRIDYSGRMMIAGVPSYVARIGS